MKSEQLMAGINYLLQAVEGYFMSVRKEYTLKYNSDLLCDDCGKNSPIIVEYASDGGTFNNVCLLCIDDRIDDQGVIK